LPGFGGQARRLADVTFQMLENEPFALARLLLILVPVFWFSAATCIGVGQLVVHECASAALARRD